MVSNHRLSSHYFHAGQNYIKIDKWAQSQVKIKMAWLNTLHLNFQSSQWKYLNIPNNNRLCLFLKIYINQPIGKKTLFFNV